MAIISNYYHFTLLLYAVAFGMWLAKWRLAVWT